MHFFKENPLVIQSRKQGMNFLDKTEPKPELIVFELPQGHWDRAIARNDAAKELQSALDVQGIDATQKGLALKELFYEAGRKTSYRHFGCYEEHPKTPGSLGNVMAMLTL